MNLSTVLMNEGPYLLCSAVKEAHHQQFNPFATVIIGFRRLLRLSYKCSLSG